MDERPPHDPDENAPNDQDTPKGAIAVTLFLTATILVLWFSMYALNVVRS